MCQCFFGISGRKDVITARTDRRCQARSKNIVVIRNQTGLGFHHHQSKKSETSSNNLPQREPTSLQQEFFFSIVAHCKSCARCPNYLKNFQFRLLLTQKSPVLFPTMSFVELRTCATSRGIVIETIVPNPGFDEYSRVPPSLSKTFRARYTPRPIP